MASRFLIYSTGTTYSTTIVRESATNNPGANEASHYTDFVIPEIQPLYLWRVNTSPNPTDVIPNTNTNILAYEEDNAPAPSGSDLTDWNDLTGTTELKIDIVTGATGNIGTFVADGNLDDSGYAISDLTGGTNYNFTGSGGTQVFTGSTGNPVEIIIYSTPPTGSTVAWGDITGTLSNQTDLQNALDAKTDNSTFNTFTGTTLPANYYNKTEINTYTGQTLTNINSRLLISDFNQYSGDTDTRLDNIEDVTNIALTGATNGLLTNGRNVELGGALTRNTLISGTTFDFNINTKYIKLQVVNGIDIIDTDGVGGINIESDAGTISLVGNTNVGVPQTKLEISETQMLITDSRTGATRIGLEYAGDYSTTFTNESLITKRYADTIASGLIPKATTLVATTGETIDLGTGGLLTVDGVTLSNGDRVLVKDQSDASQNGIYIASASTWIRSTDFDGNPDGEVSAGNIIPVQSGNTQYSSLWVLVTPNPITIGTTDLEFTLFSSPHEMIAGTGIDIAGNVISVDGASLAGNSISWTGNTYNVDVNSGTLSTALDSKLNVTDFNYYSGTTVPATYLSIDNFNTFTGTTLPTNYYNKTEINVYTGATDTRLDTIESEITYISGVTDTKLDKSIFTGYTASTASNEIFLTHTGGTELNTVTAIGIDWDTIETSGSSYIFSGGTDIWIQENGDYELSYNIPFVGNNNASLQIGSNIILNGTTVINITASAGMSARNLGAGSANLSPITLSLTAGQYISLAMFRTGSSGSVTSKLTGSILIKKKNTLQ